MSGMALSLGSVGVRRWADPDVRRLFSIPFQVRWFQATALPPKLRDIQDARPFALLRETSDFADAIFTGVRFVPCKRSLQTRSDDGSTDDGRDVARSGGTAG